MRKSWTSIYIEQWALHLLHVPAKTRRKRFKEAIDQAVEELIERQKVHQLVAKGAKIRFNQKED